VVAGGRERAISSRSAIVATTMIFAVWGSLIGIRHRDAEVSDGTDAAAGGDAKGLFPGRERGSAGLDDPGAGLRGLAPLPRRPRRPHGRGLPGPGPPGAPGGPLAGAGPPGGPDPPP